MGRLGSICGPFIFLFFHQVFSMQIRTTFLREKPQEFRYVKYLEGSTTHPTNSDLGKGISIKNPSPWQAMLDI